MIYTVRQLVGVWLDMHEEYSGLVRVCDGKVVCACHTDNLMGCGDVPAASCRIAEWGEMHKFWKTSEENVT